MTDEDPNEPTAPLWQPPAAPPAGQQPGNPYPPPYPQQSSTPYGQPPVQPYGQPYQQPYAQPGGPAPTRAFPVQDRPSDGSPGQLGATGASPSGPGKGKVPGWLWPAVAALALVLGVIGGSIAGAIVADNDQDGPGQTLRVERRTAPPLPADNTSIASVAAKVLPSTVQIIAEYDGSEQGATGSGFVIDRQGHVITNSHVIAEADEKGGPIRIIDQDGNRMKATVVGRSTVYDLAVLKSEGAKKLQPAAIGSADQMRVGETVVAIGSPLGLSATVTSGIISAVNRPVTTGEGDSDNSYINAVQTDAAINPGNSGGPLVNLQGEVVGVNSAIASLGSQIASDQGGNIGVGFAIPIEQVEVTTAQILKSGTAQYPVMGANVQGTEERDGAEIESVTSGMPADDADLRVGDIIRRVDGKPVTGSIDLVVAIRSHVPGEKVELTVERGSKTFKVKVGLDAKTG